MVHIRLKDRVVFITGGGSGIGRASAERMASDGAKVVVADIEAEHAREVAQRIKLAGGTAVPVYCDVSSEDSVESALTTVLNMFGRLDVMFNNAGISVRKPMLETSSQEYERVVKVNQFGVFYGMRGAAARMVAQGNPGVIINTVSVYAYVASESRIPYHAAKAAVDMMTKAAALELRTHGIRVVGVAPGFVDTPLVQTMNTDPETWKRLSQDVHMRGRVIHPDEVAQVVAFLASDDAFAINGTVVAVDDGFTVFK